MKKNIVNFINSAVLAVIGIIIATTCTAASNSTLNNSKNNFSIYADGNIGFGSVEIDSDSYNDLITGAAPSQFNNNGFAWAADLGLQFNKFIALEAGYISFGQSSANTSYDYIPLNDKDTFGGFDVLLKGILPVNNKFNLFAKLGTADMNDDGTSSGSNLVTSKVTGSTWTPLVGIGASYDINQNVSLNLQDMYSGKTAYQINNISIDMPALNALLAGASFKFNV